MRGRRKSNSNNYSGKKVNVSLSLETLDFRDVPSSVLGSSAYDSTLASLSHSDSLDLAVLVSSSTDTTTLDSTLTDTSSDGNTSQTGGSALYDQTIDLTGSANSTSTTETGGTGSTDSTSLPATVSTTLNPSTAPTGATMNSSPPTIVGISSSTGSRVRQAFDSTSKSSTAGSRSPTLSSVDPHATPVEHGGVTGKGLVASHNEHSTNISNAGSSHATSTTGNTTSHLMTADDTTGGGTTGGTQSGNPAPPPSAPQIVSFGAVEVVGGVWDFTGTVIDANPAGLTVSFGGEPVSLQGASTTTEANGNFIYATMLNTNGSDNGTATAQTTDGQGYVSNLAMCEVTAS